MADVQPFKALHYDLAKVGSLDKVAAPPYDVIDAAGRARLMERSPYNAVAIDLPKAFDPADPLYLQTVRGVGYRLLTDRT